MSFDVLCLEADTMPESPRTISRDARSEANCADASTRTDKPLRPANCDVMLKVLGRDNELRRRYVQRRWQGLAE
jgi:hypothetical protein